HARGLLDRDLRLDTIRDGLASRDTGRLGGLGLDPGRIRLEGEALQRRGDRGGRLALADRDDAGIADHRVDAIDLIEPFARRRLDGVGRTSPAPRVAERGLGAFLLESDVARV